MPVSLLRKVRVFTQVRVMGGSRTAILLFPRAAGWLIAVFGYPALSTVLVSFAAAQAAIAWWRVFAARKPEKGANARPGKARRDGQNGRSGDGRLKATGWLIHRMSYKGCFQKFTGGRGSEFR